MLKKPFVLSGGGARGFAHIGVVKALNEHQVYPSAISGTSAGAIAGAFLANGYTPREIMEMLSGKLTRKLLSWNSLQRGLISFDRLADFLEANLRYKSFEELPIPLYITVTSFIDGRQKIISTGNIMDAIRASCAIPAIFPIVQLDEKPYVDGGLANNLPVEPFILRKKEVICVHVNPIRDLSEKTGLFDTIERAFHLSFAELVRQSAHGCLMMIEPRELVAYSMFDLKKSSEIIDAGYRYALEYLDQNQHLLREDGFFRKLRARLPQWNRRTTST
jgi:NTE family protein